MTKHKLPLAIYIVTFFSAVSIAHADHRQGRSCFPALPEIPKLADYYSQSRNSGAQGKKPNQPQAPAANPNVQCGDVITSSMSLAADLNCPNTTGFALIVEGDGVVLDGKGHKIIAPLAVAGVYVQGSKDTIENLVIQGITQGSGIDVYDSPGVSIIGNNVSGNQTGILLYAENTTMSNVVVRGNEARGNSLFGLRTGWDTNGIIQSPLIQQNDFSQSGSYGMYVMAQNYELNGFDLNDVSKSLNGYYLALGNFYIHDLAMSFMLIPEVQIFVDSALSVKVRNVDASSVLPALASQERIGMDLYRCSQFDIASYTSWASDVGLKLETEEGTSPTGTVNGCSFVHNSTAAILAVSYDRTPFGAVNIIGTTALEVLPAVDFLLAGNTLLGLKSLIQFQLPFIGNGCGH